MKFDQEKLAGEFSWAVPSKPFVQHCHLLAFFHSVGDKTILQMF